MEGNNNNYNGNNNGYYPFNNDYPLDEYVSRLNNNNNLYLNEKNEQEKYNGKNIITISDQFSFAKLLVFIIIIVIIIVTIILIKNLSKKYRVVFYLNGANAVEKDEMNCRSNVFGHCYLTLPIAKKYDGEVIGYAKTPAAKEAEYQIGEEIEITEDTDLYVISKKQYKLEIAKGDIDEVEAEKLVCDVYNEEKSCVVTVPMYNKKGYVNEGYSEKRGKMSDLIKIGSQYELDANKKLYPVYNEFPKLIQAGTVHYKIENSIRINNTYLDIGRYCNSNVSNILVQGLQTLYSNFPFYSYYGKITVLGDNDFIGHDGVAYRGLNTAYGITRIDDVHNPIVLLRCNNDGLPIYATAVHELTHAFDARYKGFIGNYASDEDDLIELRDKYYNEKSKPLRSYAYSPKQDKGEGVVVEFFAELMTFYYINYVDTNFKEQSPYLRGNFPDDMKKVAEKYICIGRNNFDKSKCS